MNNRSLLSDILACCDRKLISYIDINSESENENDNQFILIESCRFRFIFGSVLYAVYACWNVTERLYIRRNYV